eukprot:5141110-Prymnesium_polylepis.1
MSDRLAGTSLLSAVGRHANSTNCVAGCVAGCSHGSVRLSLVQMFESDGAWLTLFSQPSALASRSSTASSLDLLWRFKVAGSNAEIVVGKRTDLEAACRQERVRWAMHDLATQGHASVGISKLMANQVTNGFKAAKGPEGANQVANGFNIGSNAEVA